MIPTLFFGAMQAGLNRTDQILSNYTPKASTKEFIQHHLNGSFLGKDFQLEFIDTARYRLRDSEEGWFTANPTLAIMFSGGIDSALAPFYAMHDYGFLPKDILLVSVNYGQPYTAAEQVAQKELALFFNFYYGISWIRYDFIDTEDSQTPAIVEEQMPKGYIIPFRNATIGAVGANHASLVWMMANYRSDDAGKTAASGVSDKSEEFFSKLSQVLSIEHENSKRIWSPVSHLSKAETVNWLLSKESKETCAKIFEHTVSCYGATVEHAACGRCYTCYKTWSMFKKTGLLEWKLIRNKFAEDPDVDPQCTEYNRREQNKGRH